MIGGFYKSRIYAIIKAFRTSPLWNCIGGLFVVCACISIFVGIVGLAVTIIYLIANLLLLWIDVNLYLVGRNILYNISNDPVDTAAFWIGAEVITMIFIIATFISCRDTYYHIDKELQQYELEMVHVNR